MALFAKLVERPRKTLWRWLIFVLTLIAAAAAALASVNHGSLRVWLYVGGGVTAGLLLWSQYLRDDAAERAKNAAVTEADNVRVISNDLINNALSPLLRVLAQIDESNDPDEQQQLWGAFEHGVVAAVPTALVASDLRCCFFLLESETDGSPKALKIRYPSGRADQPHTTFKSDTPEGQAAIKMLLDDSFTFCADTETSPPPGWQDHPHDYRTFLSVPVRGQDAVVGMLTVDGLHPGDLVLERDKPILALFARILAVGEISQLRRRK
jgi:hypothetical protein